MDTDVEDTMENFIQIVSKNDHADTQGKICALFFRKLQSHLEKVKAYKQFVKKTDIINVEEERPNQNLHKTDSQNLMFKNIQ